jgi:hypothetical protein
MPLPLPLWPLFSSSSRLSDLEVSSRSFLLVLSWSSPLPSPLCGLTKSGLIRLHVVMIDDI